MMKFAENLKKIRVEKNISQQQLANKLGIAQSTVGMWESGRRTPKIAELDRLARILDITTARLLGDLRERKVEIVQNEIYIDGKRVNELDSTDIAGIVDYINTLRTTKDKTVQGATGDTASRPKRVLVIDDEQEMCEILYTFLLSNNYKAFLAFNGQMGLEYFDEVKPDLVLLDLKMPDMHGVEVLRTIRTVSNVPVVIITGNPQDVSEIHLADLEIEGYIEKPIRLVDVLNTLKYLIGE